MSKFVSSFAKENIFIAVQKRNLLSDAKAGIPHGNAHLVFFDLVRKLNTKKPYDPRHLRRCDRITPLFVWGFAILEGVLPCRSWKSMLAIWCCLANVQMQQSLAPAKVFMCENENGRPFNERPPD